MSQRCAEARQIREINKMVDSSYTPIEKIEKKKKKIGSSIVA